MYTVVFQIYTFFFLYDIQKHDTAQQKLINLMHTAGNEIDQLCEILPICSNCKKYVTIMDSGTNWKPIWKIIPPLNTFMASALNVSKYFIPVVNYAENEKKRPAPFAGGAGLYGEG